LSFENIKHVTIYHVSKFHGKISREGENMESRYLERLVGKYCKIVTKEPGDEKASVINGILEGVDYIDRFILINSSQGLGYISMETVLAIKPGNKNKKFDEMYMKKES
jgi:hypothetical protein